MSHTVGFGSYWDVALCSDYPELKVPSIEIVWSSSQNTPLALALTGVPSTSKLFVCGDVKPEESLQAPMKKEDIELAVRVWGARIS